VDWPGVLDGTDPLAAYPVATHEEAEAHDTPWRAFAWELDVSALVTVVQAVPFQLSTRLWVAVPSGGVAVPTAMQALLDAQSTPRSWLGSNGAVSVVVTTFHAVPFHCSARVWLALASPVAWYPTAMHDAEEVHETPSRRFDWVLVVSALGTIDHEVPSKVSTRVCSAPVDAFTALPTAVHDVADGHDTEASTLASELEVFGLGTIDHEVPSKASVRVWSAPLLPLAAYPTAMHMVEPEVGMHDTEASTLASELEVFGLGTIDHEVPSKASARVWSALLVPVVA
jgi:hypothetical protein